MVLFQNSEERNIQTTGRQLTSNELEMMKVLDYYLNISTISCSKFLNAPSTPNKSFQALVHFQQHQNQKMQQEQQHPHIMNCAKIQTKSSLLYTEFSPYICLAGMNPRKCIYTSRLLTPCMKRIRLDSLTASYGDNNNSNSALLVYSSY